MKIRQLKSFLSLTAITLTGTLLPNTPAFSQTKNFFCGTSPDGSLATMVQSPQHGDITIIKWSSNHFKAGGYDNQTRCNIVSQRFQKHHSQGTLNYIIDGKVNRYPVICVVSSQNDACNSNNILWTLKRGDNSQEKLQKLFDIRSGGTGLHINETFGVKSGQRISVDFEKFLEKKVQENSVNNNFLF